MNSIYFEEKGEALLEKIGMPKAEFARKMGIQRQNVRALFKSKDLRVIQRAADVMGVPWIFLVGYADEEPDIYQLPIPSYECNKQTYFVLFFVKLIVHFAGRFRGSLVPVYY